MTVYLPTILAKKPMQAVPATNDAPKTGMITLTLPDGSTREYAAGTTGLQVAESIGKGLAKAALAIELDGEQRDLSRPIDASAKLRIITGDSAEGLEIIRHDSAHIMAQAVKELYPDTQVTIGPAIEDGFYYDFARATPFSTEDLEKIEAKMREISEKDIPFEREVWGRDEAVEFFKKQGEAYKAEIIGSIPAGEDVTLYRQGDFIDLCRGPHAPSTGKIRHYKLMKVAGAYWRGDSKNAMLQRIYGTAWGSEKQLKEYLTRLEEAEKRDHRRLGREMGLFHIQEEAVGQIFWHNRGWTLYTALQDYIRRRLRSTGYVEIKTPMILDRILWEKSGHWEKYGENMFNIEHEDKTLCLKPMNCPGHVQVFNQSLKSYRDLPLRLAEFGSCHRNESSGSMHGLMRVRGFVQDDAHIFCTEEQITSETIAFCELLRSVYEDLGFPDFHVKFSDRPEKRAGDDAIWDRAEGALKAACEAAGLETELNPGEGAFYGPKLEFVLRDAIGRDWQCGTLQVDFVLPERLDANYIGTDAGKHRPVMLHRAILGSFERFIGVLIEHYAGKLPMWLAPKQVAVCTITDEAMPYVREQVLPQLDKLGVRWLLNMFGDDEKLDKNFEEGSNQKIDYLIRHHSTAKVPAIVVVGKREAEQGSLGIRRLGSPQTVTMPLAEAITELSREATPPDLLRG
jgi:threonyl-tRNA synthetase